MRDSISIIIPAYNEEKRIEPTLKHIIKYCENNYKRYEILVVNDGSKDHTAKIAARYATVITHQKNQGKGAAVRTGMLAAKHARRLFTDSDLATPIKELEKLEQAIDEGADIAIASRNLPQSDVRTKQPFYRAAMGKFFAQLVRIIAIQDFADTQCGFKLFTAKAAEHVFKKLKVKDYTFDVEALCIAKQTTFRIQEVPVVWIDQPGSKIRPLHDSIHMLKQLLRIRKQF